MSAASPAQHSGAEAFRPDIEGLRAVAVVLVVLYHAGLPGVGGGYVGVDVFFVLSGFLITGLLLRELGRTGTVSLPNFYARRVRRLLPAALLVLLVTVAAAAAVLAPLEVPNVAGDAAAAALYVSNLRFAVQATDYLQAQQAPSPVLHFWSLGVEEQFYLFWPAIVLLVGRATRVPARRIGMTAAIISACSFALAIWLTSANQPWAFFSLPTRAWELGLGAILAVGAGRLAAIPSPLATVLGWAGLGLVVLSGVALSVDTPFPGTAALMPTVGSALVIAAGFRPGALAVARPLATALPRFLGRISYSLYLWHWPLLVLPAAALGGVLPWPERAALVTVAVALAALTQRLVEDPLRRGRVIGTVARRNLALAGTFSLVVALASIGIGNVTVARLSGSASTNTAADEADLQRILAAHAASQPSPEPSVASASAATSAAAAAAAAASADGPGASPGPTPLDTSVPGSTPPATADEPVPAGLRPPLAQAASDLPAPVNDGCNLSFGGTRSPPCVYGNPSGRTTIVLFGDSHALAWFPAVERIAIDRGWRFVNLTKSSCGSADVVQWLDALNRMYGECAEWRANTLARIAAEHPALVILANSRAVPIVGPGGTVLRGRPAIPTWQAGLERTEARIAAIVGVKLAVIGDSGRSAFDVPACLSQHLNSILACATPFSGEISPEWVAAAAAAASVFDATFVDPTAWVCPSRPCPPVIGNFLVYRDQHHLSVPFAEALAGNLADALSPSLP